MYGLGRDLRGAARDRARPSEIALADIVSGKPVPPRPSIRLRVGPAEAQLRGMALFPDLETEPLGDWLLRRSPTATARRAELGARDGSVGRRRTTTTQVVAFYAARTGRPIAAVLPDSDEDALFRAHGWVAESNDADTLFQVAVGLAGAAWLGLAVPTTGDLEEDGDLVTVRIGDRASGHRGVRPRLGRLPVHRGRPDQRRQGLGLAVMAALVEWGAERGATTAYLQVLGDNAPALALYERLGFVTHHAYRYLVAGQPAPRSCLTARRTARRRRSARGQHQRISEQHDRAGEDHPDDVDAQLVRASR